MKKKEDEIKPPKIDNIFEAINYACSNVKVLEKKNDHLKKFKFASIDDFLKAVNPICADAGLFPHCQTMQIEHMAIKEHQYLRYHFSITLYHRSGQTLPPIDYYVSVLNNGAQASGSAQSYALKQFFRALFMIPTGDKDDPDFHKIEDLVELISDKELSTLHDLLEKAGADIEAFRQIYGENFSEMRREKFVEAEALLKRKIKQQRERDVKTASEYIGKEAELL